MIVNHFTVSKLHATNPSFLPKCVCFLAEIQTIWTCLCSPRALSVRVQKIFLRIICEFWLKLASQRQNEDIFSKYTCDVAVGLTSWLSEQNLYIMVFSNTKHFKHFSRTSKVFQTDFLACCDLWSSLFLTTLRSYLRLYIFKV